jgi:hypothetical protein
MAAEDGFVDDFDTEETETPGLAPAADGSTLASLRARREKAIEKLHLDLEVPRLDPQVFVRFKPVSQERLNAANKQAGKSSDKDAEVIANAGILAWACLGVFEVIDGEEVSIDVDDREGEWPKFDKRLAGLLGVRAGKASEVVRGLYLTDGDIISTVGKLGVWSGYATDQLESDPAGN